MKTQSGPLFGNAAKGVVLAFALLCAHAVGGEAFTGADGDRLAIAAMQERYGALREQLDHNAFHMPLVLQSSEVGSTMQGDVYALLDFPLSAVSARLRLPEQWCEILILHINTKYCHVFAESGKQFLRIQVGKKTPEELVSTTRLEPAFLVEADSPDRLKIRLYAKDGPAGIVGFQIILEAAALPAGKTFLMLRYTYAFNMVGRLAVQTYLGTAGRDKVGFTVLRTQTEGQPVYIAGTRGMVERNTMRYFMAVVAYMQATSAPPELQQEQRLQNWFALVDRYPRQLWEMDKAVYIDMKRPELARQKTFR